MFILKIASLTSFEFSHTTGSHAKPNHAAWPLLITDYINERTNLKRCIHNRTKKLVWKNNLKTAVTRRLNTNKSPHNKQEMEKTNFRKKLQKTRRVGGREVRQWWTATRKVSNPISHVTYTPCTLAPRCVWGKRFPLLSCLSQRKTTLCYPERG